MLPDHAHEAPTAARCCRRTDLRSHGATLASAAGEGAAAARCACCQLLAATAAEAAEADFDERRGADCRRDGGLSPSHARRGNQGPAVTRRALAGAGGCRRPDWPFSRAGRAMPPRNLADAD